MLVLSRRLNEKVLFPGLQASVQVVGVKGNVVRLGIEAPPGVRVLREELAESAGLPRGFPTPAGRAAPDPEPDGSVARRLGAACAELAALTNRQRAALPPGEAEVLARIEAHLHALRRRLIGRADAAPLSPDRSLPGGERRRRALLVEDNPNERELLATFLRMAGLSVDTAGDGADALGYLHSHTRPDVILMDMGLPRCDGPTAVRAIRRDPALSGVRIVAVSGHRAEEFNLEAGPAGVDRWFQKPVDPNALVRDLEQDFAERQES